MGVDITAIFRHNFYELDDFDKSMDFARQTIDEIKQRLHLTGDYDDFCLYGYYDDKYNTVDISFRLADWDFEFQLRRGFWQTWYGISYNAHIIERKDGILHVQAVMYDIARVLGASEAWYSDDMFSQAYDDMTLEQVLEYAKSRFGQIYEYPDAEETVQPFYHDDFSETKKLFDEVQKRCGSYELDSIIKNCGNHYTVKRNGKYNLMHSKTFKLMFDEDVDDIYSGYYDAFVVVANEKSAVYDDAGNPLTDFVEGEFEWSWLKPGYAVLVLNATANIRIVIINRWRIGQVLYLVLSEDTTGSPEEIAEHFYTTDCGDLA